MPLNTFANQTTALPLSQLDANFTGLADLSLTQFIASGTGAVTRTVLAKERDIVSVKDYGATGDGVTDDTAAIASANTTLNPYFPKATGYSITTMTFAATTFAVANGRQSPVNISGTGGVAISGSNVTAKDFRISAPGSAQIFYATATAANVRIISADISSDVTAAPNGHGVQVNQASSHNWMITNSLMTPYNYGVLINNTAGGSKGTMVLGNNIVTQIGDAIELNTPTTALEDSIILGNVLQVAAGSGTAKGFGIGAAHTNGAIIAGNVIQRSWLEAIHIEDGSKNTTVYGNVAKACLSDGIRHVIGGAGSNQAQDKALTIIANQLEAASIVAGTAGIRVVSDGSGTPYGDTIVGNVVRNFESGIWCGSNSTYHVDGNVIDSCTYSVRCEGGNTTYTRIAGSNTVIGTATALLYISSGTGAMVQAGKFICDTKPTAVISKAAPGTTRPGCSVSGFSWPQTKTLTAGVNTYDDIVPSASTRFDGKITIQARNNAGISDNTWYSANISFDGTTLTITNAISEYNGGLAMTAPGLRVSGGNLQMGFFHASAVTIRIDVNFDGVYMA